MGRYDAPPVRAVACSLSRRRARAGADLQGADPSAAGRRADLLPDDRRHGDGAGQWRERLVCAHPRHQRQLSERQLEARGESAQRLSAALLRRSGARRRKAADLGRRIQFQFLLLHQSGRGLRSAGQHLDAARAARRVRLHRRFAVDGPARRPVPSRRQVQEASGGPRSRDASECNWLHCRPPTATSKAWSR